MTAENISNPKAEKPCVFCQIVEGKLPAEVVYRGEKTLVILSLDQDQHPIMLPTQHYKNWADPNFDPEAAKEISLLRLTLIPLVQKVYNVTGVAAIALTGRDAGQQVEHAHEHLVPCPPGQKTFIVRENSFSLTREQIVTELKANLNEQMQAQEQSK